MINRLLVWLGLREPPPMYDPTFIELMKPIAWTFYGGYGRGVANDHWILTDTATIATAEWSTFETYECDHSTSVKHE